MPRSVIFLLSVIKTGVLKHLGRTFKNQTYGI